jgi:hypothetical protein
MYDIKVNGVKYGLGKFPPKGITQGDYVSFSAEAKGKYWNVKAGTLSKQDKPAAVEAPKAAGGSSFYSDNRQTVISKQAAVNTSLTFVKLLSDNGALPMPAKVASDKKADLIEQIVMEYAAKFYNFSTGEKLEVPSGDALDLASVEEAGNWQE